MLASSKPLGYFLKIRFNMDSLDTHAYILKGRSLWQISSSQCSSWNWRKLLQLRSLAYRFVEMKNGIEVWKFPGSRYSTAQIWKEIRPRKEKVDWHRLVWTPMAIPKHIIIDWMAILNRLPTMDRLKGWGIELNGTCRLCQQEQESRDHLFFDCFFSQHIWRNISQLCGLWREC